MSIYSTKASIEKKIFRQIPLAVFNTLDVEFGFGLDVVDSDQNVPRVNCLTLLSFINTKTGKQEEYGNSKARLFFVGRCKEKLGCQISSLSRKLLMFPVDGGVLIFLLLLIT